MKIPTDLDPKPPLRRILAQNPPPPVKEILDPPLYCFSVVMWRKALSGNRTGMDRTGPVAK